MNRYILPHLYLFFGIIVFFWANPVLLQVNKIYWFINLTSIFIAIIGLVWIMTLLFSKKTIK